MEKHGKCYAKHEAVQNALKEHRSGRRHLVASIIAGSANTEHKIKNSSKLYP